MTPWVTYRYRSPYELVDATGAPLAITVPLLQRLTTALHHEYHKHLSEGGLANYISSRHPLFTLVRDVTVAPTAQGLVATVKAARALTPTEEGHVLGYLCYHYERGWGHVYGEEPCLTDPVAYLRTAPVSPLPLERVEDVQ